MKLTPPSERVQKWASNFIFALHILTGLAGAATGVIAVVKMVKH